MSNFFPMFIDISDKNFMVVGAGSVAARRIKKLLLFECNITVVAREISDEILEISSGRLRIYRAEYDKKFLKGMDYCIASTQDPELNRRIAKDCRDMGIGVNDASDKRNCDFYFPALIKKEDLIVGICASGNDHSLAREIREILEREI